ncbi:MULTISPECIES: type 1 glutamine amidotransferase domain-containing protein [Oceanobacillus]|uniref:type 1 glutamine amidotransferase domain-containing protein n=1 Tax=Oceanobacillus TaxID=182709 RepID=UPI0026E2FEDA|nr:type 1 glutamine amidotransferase domain-containing protein [Oceanobacillus profundus]MDO6447785.1 type 1 glutamine amidotransferase domain-containing protein [Oceanobacillus profundus]
MANVCFLLADGYEDSEMKNPYDAMNEAGHKTVVVGLEKGTELKGKKGTAAYTSELSISEVKADDYDAVIIPGGSAPEALRVSDEVVEFVKQAHEQGKVIAGICHGPQVMISADILNGVNSTSYIGVRDDVKNAGANFLDQEVVVDGNIITSRTPKDEPAFIKEILNKL